MLYKPNYCCNCGEKIERIEWNLLTSRRFCEVCSSELKRYDFLPRIAVSAGVLAFVFGLGSFLGGRSDATPPAGAPVQSPAQLKSEPERPRVTEPTAQVPQRTAATDTNTQSAQTQNNVPAVPAKVYYCGALTKKGTPCSRKVKAAGLRCYQHEGKPGAGN